MHPFYLLLLLAIFPALSYAQVQRGDYLLVLSPSLSNAPAAEPVPLLGSGAGFSYSPELSLTAIRYGTKAAYAVSDRLLLGASLAGSVDLSDNGYRYNSLSPLARYYVLNRSRLQVFGELSSSIQSVNKDVSYFKDLSVGTGLHLPVSPGVLFTPRLDYHVLDGNNIIQLSMGVELKLNRGENTETPVAGFRRGRWMFGGQVASLALRENANAVGVQLGSHYFLTDRLAAGLQLGYSRNHLTFGPVPGVFERDRKATISQYQLAAAARYYVTSPGHFAWFAEVGAGRNWSTLKTNINIDYTNQPSSFATVGFGGQLYLRENVALEAGPQLRYNVTDESWTYGLNFGARFLL